MKRSIFSVLAIALTAVACTGCPLAKTVVADVPTGPTCDLVAVGSGSTFAGVVCSGVVDIVKGVVASLPQTAAPAGQEFTPCKLAQIHTKDGASAGSVCAEIAPAVQAALDK